MDPAPRATTADSATRGAKRRLVGQLLLVAVLVAAVHAGLLLFADARSLGAELGQARTSDLGVLVLLVVVGLALRCLRWHDYMRRLGVRIPVRDSVTIYLAGFALTVTPGKVGELLRSTQLRRRYGVPLSRSAPLLVVERGTDFLALAAWVVIGLATPEVAALALVALLASILGAAPLCRGVWPSVRAVVRRSPRLERLGDRADAAVGAVLEVISPGGISASFLIGFAAWGTHCAGLFLMARGAGSLALGFQDACTSYCVPLIFGAVAMIPGGLGLTEGSMTGLLLEFGGEEASRADAVALTIIIRFATLWLTVAIGVVAYLLLRRRPPSPSSPGG